MPRPDGRPTILERRSAETRRLILDAAREVLEEHGHGGFSIGKVAEVAGISPGNLTYHYRTRPTLLVALAEDLRDAHVATFEAHCMTVDLHAEGWAEQLLGWLLDDAVDADTVRLIPELWSVGNAIPDAADAIRALYDAPIELVIRAFGHDPEDPATEPLRLAILAFACALQGTTPLFGFRDDPDRWQSVRASLIDLHAPAIERAHAQVAAGRAASIPSSNGSVAMSDAPEVLRIA